MLISLIASSATESDHNDTTPPPLFHNREYMKVSPGEAGAGGGPPISRGSGSSVTVICVCVFNKIPTAFFCYHRRLDRFRRHFSPRVRPRPRPPRRFWWRPSACPLLCRRCKPQAVDLRPRFRSGYDTAARGSSSNASISIIIEW